MPWWIDDRVCEVSLAVFVPIESGGRKMLYFNDLEYFAHAPAIRCVNGAERDVANVQRREFADAGNCW